MHYLFVLSLLAALSLPLSVIASLCNKENQPIRAMAWYESWATPPSISFEKYTTLTYSFALVTFHFFQFADLKFFAGPHQMMPLRSFSIKRG
jgi:hypothetical protein